VRLPLERFELGHLLGDNKAFNFICVCLARVYIECAVRLSVWDCSLDDRGSSKLGRSVRVHVRLVLLGVHMLFLVHLVNWVSKDALLLAHRHSFFTPF
jgi:hypothetical protein